MRDSKLRLAVLTGGRSIEATSSYDSARDVISHLNSDKYELYVVDCSEEEWAVKRGLHGKQIATINRADFSFKLQGNTLRFDCVFIIMHGGEGENGSLQGYFEMLQLPYTGSGILASALCMNKFQCKQFLRNTNVALPKGYLVKEDNSLHLPPLPFPLVVKPNTSGSSYGVSKVYSAAELREAVERALQYDTEVLIEEAIEGTEVTIGVMVSSNGQEHVLPVTQTQFEGDVFDTDSKLIQEHTRLLTPAPLPEATYNACQQAALKVYKALGCSSLARIDFILRRDQPYFLEVNTIPGMMLKSSIPRQLQLTNYGLSGFYDLMVEDALHRSKKNRAALNTI